MVVRLPKSILQQWPQRAVGKIRGKYQSGNIVESTGFLAISEGALVLVFSGHAAVSRSEGILRRGLFLLQQKSDDDRSLHRSEGVFVIGFDEDVPNRAISLPEEFDYLEDSAQGGSLDLATVPLVEDWAGHLMDVYRGVALSILLDQAVEGVSVQFVGYPQVGPSPSPSATLSNVISHSSTIKGRLSDVEGIPGGLIREGLGAPGWGGSGGPWVVGMGAIGLMAWQLPENEHDEAVPDSYSPYFSSALFKSMGVISFQV